MRRSRQPRSDRESKRPMELSRAQQAHKVADWEETNSIYIYLLLKRYILSQRRIDQKVSKLLRLLYLLHLFLATESLKLLLPWVDCLRSLYLYRNFQLCYWEGACINENFDSLLLARNKRFHFILWIYRSKKFGQFRTTKILGDKT